MNKIALVATRFDSSPPWLDFWLLSAALNPFIDFLLFTDCIEDRGIPNVRIVRTSFADLVRGCGERIGVEVPAMHYSKAYDLRPTFGESLAPWLADYEIWGYCDVDCIFGDLSLMGASDNTSYDAHLVSARHPMGFLSFFRNRANINMAWRSGRNAIDYLRREHAAPLDEVWFGKVLDALPGIRQNRANRFVWPTASDAGATFSSGVVAQCGIEYACCHFGGPGGWRDQMAVFDFNPASDKFRIDQSGMVSL